VKQRIFAGTPEDKYGWLQEYVDLMNKLNENEDNKLRSFTVIPMKINTWIAITLKLSNIF
jgi:hypothetical protein